MKYPAIGLVPVSIIVIAIYLQVCHRYRFCFACGSVFFQCFGDRPYTASHLLTPFKRIHHRSGSTILPVVF